MIIYANYPNALTSRDSFICAPPRRGGGANPAGGIWMIGLKYPELYEDDDIIIMGFKAMFRVYGLERCSWLWFKAGSAVS